MLPVELVVKITTHFLEDDIGASLADILSLSMVNRHFHRIVQNRLRTHLRLWQRQDGFTAMAYSPHRQPIQAYWLPAMVQSLDLYTYNHSHGLCEHSEAALDLSHYRLQTLRLIPDYTDTDVPCGSQRCTTLPLLRPRTLVIRDPFRANIYLLSEGVVSAAVHHVVLDLTGFTFFRWKALEVLCAYLRGLPHLENITLLIPRDHWDPMPFVLRDLAAAFQPPVVFAKALADLVQDLNETRPVRLVIVDAGAKSIHPRCSITTGELEVRDAVVRGVHTERFNFAEWFLDMVLDPRESSTHLELCSMDDWVASGKHVSILDSTLPA